VDAELVAWLLTGFLSVAFLGAGGMKLATPRATLLENPQMGWAADFSAAQIKAIGAIEVLAVLGLIFPWLLDVVPVLTPLAASGLVVTMLAAIAVHARRRELPGSLPINGTLLALAVVVAVLRFGQL
jgi:uncharacterized membrane protein YphA (DoxX/SURF4 family)